MLHPEYQKEWHRAKFGLRKRLTLRAHSFGQRTCRLASAIFLRARHPTPSNAWRNEFCLIATLYTVQLLIFSVIWIIE